LRSLLDGFAAQNAAKRAELHRSARLPIARIAKRVANRIGYRFGQHFKRLFLTTPAAYRAT
jgi:transcriptional regulator GlxA family with amidase domain